MNLQSLLEQAKQISGQTALSLDSNWNDLLTSSCVEVRELGFHLACYRSAIDLDTCLDIGLNDPETRLRCLALDLIASLDEALESHLTPGILRDLALDITQPEAVRIEAYRTCLFITDLVWESPKRYHEINSVGDIDPQLLRKVQS